ncbi:DNA-directed RNA polymerase subunit delta [Staphylococcus pseudintermedius]
MKLQDYTQEMVDEKSFIDMVYTLLSEQNATMNLYDIIDEFKRIGHYEDAQIEDRIVQFYTDLNTDGRFLSVGDNVWGLRDWYSVDDIEEKIAPTIQKFDILDEDDEDDEEDKNLTLLGEDDLDGDDNIPNRTDDQEDLDDPEDERVEDEIEESDLVVEEDEEDIDETYDEDDELEEEEEEETF